MLQADYENLRRWFPEAEIHVLTDDPEYWQNRFHWSVGWSDFLFLRRWFRSFRNKSIMSIGSSSMTRAWNALLRFLAAPFLKCWVLFHRRVFLFSAKRLRRGKSLLFMSPKIQTLLERISWADFVFGGGWLLPEKKAFLWSRLTLYQAAKILDKPLFLNGQHIPEFRNKTEKEEAAEILRSAYCISTRDRGQSEFRLNAFGVSSTVIHRGIDPALYLNSADEQKMSAFVVSSHVPHRGPLLIGLNINGLDPKTVPRLQNLCRAVCVRLAEELDVYYVLFGMQKYATVDEERQMQNFSLSLPSRVKFTVLPFRLDASLMKSVIARLDIVISARYHPVVFAFGSAVPAVGIAIDERYQEKLSGVFDLFDMKRFLVCISDVSENELLSRLREISELSAELRSSLIRRLVELRPLAEGSFRALNERRSVVL